MEATIFVSEIPTGVLADTYSRRASIVVSLLIQGAAIVLVGLSREPVVAIAAWGLWGFGYTFMSGAYQAWITDEVGVENVGSMFLRGTRLGFVGSFVGLGLQFARRDAVAARRGRRRRRARDRSAALRAPSLMPETGFRRLPREERGHALTELKKTATAGGRYVKLQPLLLLVLAVWFFSGMSTEALDRLWEAHFIRDIGLPAIGSLDPVVWFVLFTLPMLPLGYFGAGMLMKRFEKAPIRPAFCGAVVGLMVLMMAGQIVFGLAGGIAVAYGALVVYRVARSLTYPLEMTWLNRQITDSSVRATVISIIGQADAIGQAGGGPASGAIGNVWGIRAALVSGALLLAPAVGLFGRALGRGGNEPELQALPAPAEA